MAAAAGPAGSSPAGEGAALWKSAEAACGAAPSAHRRLFFI